MRPQSHVLCAVVVLGLAVACGEATTPLTKLSRVASECEEMTLRAARLEKFDGTSASSADCGSGPGVEEPPPSGGGPMVPGYGPGVHTGQTWSTCTNTALGDTDLDGITDACEQAVAQIFAPMMNQRVAEFEGEPMIPGEYYHGVMPPAGSYPRLRLLYIPAYFWDHGSNNDLHMDEPSPGDGEYMAFDVDYDAATDRWYIVRGFLSQHRLDYPTYSWEQFQYWGYVSRGMPIVYVADRKHANYPSAESCDNGGDYEGHWIGELFINNTDSCEGPRDYVKFPVSPAFNIGSQTRPNGSDTARVRRPWHFPNTFDPNKKENLWGWEFNGWQPGTPGGGFAKDLIHFGFIPTPTSNPPGCGSVATCKDGTP